MADYTPPSPQAVVFNFSGADYTPPSSFNGQFNFVPPVFTETPAQLARKTGLIVLLTF